MVAAGVVIRALRPEDVDVLVDFSLRAWTPVFESLRAELGDAIFTRLHPDWRAGQEHAVRTACADAHVLVAENVTSRPIGFVATYVDAFHEGMGAIDMIAVDPDVHRHGVGRALMTAAETHLRESGMDIVVVETGGDPGHAPARATYAAAGYRLLPIARYFRLLGPAD